MHAFLNIASTAARKAGQKIMRAYERLDEVKVSMKAHNDFVTEVDHTSEKIIMEEVLKNYPTHGFICEESGITAGDEHIWIIDPLDGTTNFVHGYPHFCISIAVQVNGVVEHGLIYDPVRDDMFYATKGRGAYLNDRRIRIKPCKALSKALIGLSFSQKHTPKRIDDVLTRITEGAASVRRGGSSALDLAYVAAGKLDGCYQWGMKPWDVAAGGLLVNEAGGMTVDHTGKDYLISGQLIAGDLKLIPAIEAAIKGEHDA